MNLTGLIFLLLAHYFAGRGIVRLFKLQIDELTTICMAFICGVTFHSMVPCIMQLAHVPITVKNTYIWLTGSAILLSIPLLRNIKNTKLPKLALPKLYELPYMLIFAGLMAISLWRCWYFPPTPRDVLTGVELIAEYTVKEHTMLNSAFSVDLRLNGAANNIFKSPFITGLQIIYKQLVLPFGQIWLSVLFLSFTVWFYSVIRSIVHPAIAGLLLLIYFAVPDLFAYTYIMLYDYPNMVFYFAAFYFMTKYINSRKMNELIWVSFLMGMATYIRSETLVLAAITSLLPMAYVHRSKAGIKQVAITGAVFMSGPVIFNFILSNIFIKLLIPVKFELGDLLNNNMFDVSGAIDKAYELLMGLMFSEKGEAVYAHFYYFFLAVLIIDGIRAIVTKKLSQDAIIALWGIFIVFVTLSLLSFLIPSHTIINSAKRGLFKIIPLMVLYMAHSGILQSLSAYLYRKENGTESDNTPPKPKVSVPKPAPTISRNQSKATR